MELKNHYLLIFNSLLLITSIILIIGSLKQNKFANLELNLGTELAGILLTITVINWIIKRSEEKKWEKSKKLVLKKVLKFNNKFNTAIRVFNGTQINFPNTKPTEENIINFNIELLESTENNILPEIQQSILRFQPTQWKELFDSFKDLDNYLREIISLFGERIDPEIHSDLLSIHTFLEEILNNYDAIPEVYLYPSNKLTTEQLTNSNILKRQFAQNLEDPLKIAISMNKKLLKDGYN